MFDRIFEEVTKQEVDQTAVEKILFPYFEAARFKLANPKKNGSPTLLQRWKKSRTNRNDLIRLMWEFELLNIPEQLDALIPIEPGKPTVSHHPKENEKFAYQLVGS